MAIVEGEIIKKERKKGRKKERKKEKKKGKKNINVRI